VNMLASPERLYLAERAQIIAWQIRKENGCVAAGGWESQG